MGALKGNLIAKNYSRALFGAAKQSGAHEKVLIELALVSEAFSKTEGAKTFFSNPLVSKAEKREIAEKLVSEVSSAELTAALFLMIQNSRFQFLPEMKLEYEKLLDAEKGVLRGVITSASTLGEDVKKKIADKMALFFNKQIVFDFEVSSRVLGGTRAQVGGLTFDDSLEGHMNRMAEELHRSRV